ncbi:MAG: PaaI family thioesterase [Polaromonas sp.]|uniref:PaaI family thioesterase n=1 Tax=Polaromonas sp. TaxID=1869339 RepID=UPI002488EF93|nr:PaaI family thioesterase [Polaromonas sp.]MDI1236759.1 PaaI family thioesterase [Polaromonas sp.]MDI1340244.1 PaaI family thioesterase [Polaromonas sp.]
MNTSPDFTRLARAVLAMPMAQTLGLVFKRISPGEVELEMPVLDSFCFRPGQLQATAVFAAADFAAVAAAGTLLAPGWINATVDATLKLVAPAQGVLLRARGRVVSAGKLLTVCASDVYAVNAAGDEALCATLLGSARNIQPSA